MHHFSHFGHDGGAFLVLIFIVVAILYAVGNRSDKS